MESILETKLKEMICSLENPLILERKVRREYESIIEGLHKKRLNKIIEYLFLLCNDKNYNIKNPLEFKESKIYIHKGILYFRCSVFYFYSGRSFNFKLRISERSKEKVFDKDDKVNKNYTFEYSLGRGRKYSKYKLINGYESKDFNLNVIIFDSLYWILDAIFDN